MHLLLWKQLSKQGIQREINTVHCWITTNPFIKNGIPFYETVAVEAITCSKLLFNKEQSSFWKKRQFKQYFLHGVVEILSISMSNVKRAQGKTPCVQNTYTAKDFLKALWRSPLRLEYSLQVQSLQPACVRSGAHLYPHLLVSWIRCYLPEFKYAAFARVISNQRSPVTIFLFPFRSGKLNTCFYRLFQEVPPK